MRAAFAEVDVTPPIGTRKIGWMKVLVAATHNHAGPAVANVGEVFRDEACIERMVTKILTAFGEALANLQPAEIGFGHTFERRVAHNRRIIRRDGTVQTHGRFADPTRSVSKAR